MSPIKERREAKDKPEAEANPEEERTDKKLQEYTQKKEGLKEAFHEGKVSKKKFTKIRRAIEDKMQRLRDRKIAMYKKEREALEWDQLDLDKDLEEEIITKEEYQKRQDDLDKKARVLESKIRALGPEEEAHKYPDFEEEAIGARESSVFSPRLWSILTIFGMAAIIGTIVSVALVFTSLPFLGSMPPQYKSLILSQLILIPFLIVIGVLIGAGILYVSASIAGIKEATFNKALICTIAISVVGIGSNFIYAFLAMGVIMIVGVGGSPTMMLGSVFGIILTILWLVLTIYLYIWIIKDGFNTHWMNAVVVWILMAVLGVILTLAIRTLLGSLF